MSSLLRSRAASSSSSTSYCSPATATATATALPLTLLQAVSHLAISHNSTSRHTAHQPHRCFAQYGYTPPRCRRPKHIFTADRSVHDPRMQQHVQQQLKEEAQLAKQEQLASPERQERLAKRRTSSNTIPSVSQRILRFLKEHGAADKKTIYQHLNHQQQGEASAAAIPEQSADSPVQTTSSASSTDAIDNGTTPADASLEAVEAAEQQQPTTAATTSHSSPHSISQLSKILQRLKDEQWLSVKPNPETRRGYFLYTYVERSELKAKRQQLYDKQQALAQKRSAARYERHLQRFPDWLPSQQLLPQKQAEAEAKRNRNEWLPYSVRHGEEFKPELMTRKKNLLVQQQQQ